jgi:hypothetical protein
VTRQDRMNQHLYHPAALSTIQRFGIESPFLYFTSAFNRTVVDIGKDTQNQYFHVELFRVSPKNVKKSMNHLFPTSIFMPYHRKISPGRRPFLRFQSFRRTIYLILVDSAFSEILPVLSIIGFRLGYLLGKISIGIRFPKAQCRE